MFHVVTILIVTPPLEFIERDPPQDWLCPRCYWSIVSAGEDIAGAHSPCDGRLVSHWPLSAGSLRDDGWCAGGDGSCCGWCWAEGRSAVAC